MRAHDCFQRIINGNDKRDLRYHQIDHFFVVIMLFNEREKLANLAPAFEFGEMNQQARELINELHLDEFGHKEFELTKRGAGSEFIFLFFSREEHI